MMNTRRTLAAMTLLLGIGSFALTQAPATKDTEPTERIQALIQKLGSTKSSEREKATKELEAIGIPALELLKKAVKEADLETSRRADTLVRKLEEKMSTASLLAPKKVRLNVKDMPVLDAVKELAKISGYPVQVQGDRTVASDKKITLDTGETTFWEALDQLCAKAGLQETVNAGLPSFPPDGSRPPPIRIRPPRIKPLPAVPAAPLPAPAPALPPEAAPPQAVPIGVEIGQVAVVEKPAAQGQGQAEPAQAPPGKPQAQPAAPAVQVQVQPAQVQILPAFDQFPGIGGRPMMPMGIVLTPGQAKAQPTSYSGAVRVRVLPPDAKNSAREKGQHALVLDAAAEPRLQGFRIIGTPTIEKAIDDQGQSLAMAMPPMNPNGQGDPAVGGGGIVINGNNIIIQGPNGVVIQGFPGMPGMGGQRQATVRLAAGAKPAKTIKELKGHLTAEVIVPNELLITVDNVLKAAGQTVKGKSGGSIAVQTIEKTANGEYKIKLQIESPPQGNNPMGAFGGGIMIQNMQIQIGGAGGAGFGGGPVNTQGLPELVDAKGNKYQVSQIPSRQWNANNGQVAQDVTMVFRANNNQGEPASLVLFGNRTTTIQVPFAFQNVPLE